MEKHNPEKKLKILLIAEAANPDWTSVPLVGWSMCSALRDILDVHIVTHIRNSEAIKRKGLIEGEDYTIIDSELVMRPLWVVSNLIRGGKGKGWTTSMVFAALGYYYFEKLVWSKFKNDIKEGTFDIVHRITPLSPTIPSLIAKRCHENNVSFVIGPLNGGVPWPKQFDRERRMEREWLSYIRNIYKLLPGYRSTLKYSSAIIAGSHATLNQIPKAIQKKCFYLPENGIDETKFPIPESKINNETLRACFVGRLVPYKGVDMLIEAALPLIRHNKIIIDIIGDGPLMESLKKKIIEENIERKVVLYGWVDHSLINYYISKSDLFTFPSIREFGGGVILEAMALGVVPIVVDYAGPGELVTNKTGFKLALSSRESIVLELREKLQDIINGKYNMEQLSKNALSRARNSFTWAVKANQIYSVYKWVNNSDGSEKPVFFEG